MKKLLLLVLTSVSISSYGQFYVKSGMGYSASTPGGLVSEADFGYRKNELHNFSIGYFHNPFISKVFYNVKYGYTMGDFVLFGGMGLVNHFYSTDNGNRVSAYGSYVVGFEYHTQEVFKSTNLYIGTDVTDKNLSIKVGIRSFYKD